jgi:tetratricopeptide (TPR) repeat protein
MPCIRKYFNESIYYCTIAAPEKAIGPLQNALTLKPSDADGHLWLGRAFLARGLYQKAIPHLEKASDAYPHDLGLQYDLAQAHLLLSEQITDKMYRQNPDSSWAFFLRGQAYQVEGKVDLAITDFKKAIQLNPNLPDAHEALGDLYLEKRDFANAEAEFSKELETNPYNFPTVCKLADILIQTGEVNRAIPSLAKTSALKPSLGCARYELGRAWFREGQIEKAVRNLKEAVALNPTYAPAYVLLGQSYAKLGQSTKAQAAFQKSRSLDEEQLEQIHKNLIPSQPPSN